MAGLIYSASQLAIWLRDVWIPEIGVCAYEEPRIGSHFKRVMAPEGKVHYRKHIGFTTASFATGVDNDGLSPQANTEQEIVGTPQTSYVYVRTTLQAIARMMNDPSDLFRKSMESALAEGVDKACGNQCTDLTNLVGSSADNVTEALLQDAIVRAAVAMKEDFNPGVDELVFCFHPNQIDDILAISNWTHAEKRGDGENPIVKGMILRANGVKFIETGNVKMTGLNTFNNPIFVPNRTFGIGFNQEATVKMEELLMEKRLLGWVDFALLSMWADYGVNFKTTIAA
jgi:hypothetical protein